MRGEKNNLCIKEAQIESNEDKLRSSVPWKTGRQRLLLVGIATMIFLANTCFSLQAPFFPLEAAKKGVSTTVVGLIFSCYELSKCLSSPLWGYLISKIGVKFMFLSGLIVCGSCAILFGVLIKGPDGWSFILLCFLCRSLEGVGTAAFMTAGYAIVAHEFSDNTAAVYGVLQACIGVGNMAGPPIGGALYAVGGYGLPFYVNGGVVIGVGLLCCLVLPPLIDKDEDVRQPVLRMIQQPFTIVLCFSIIAGSFSLGFLDPTLALHLSELDLDSVVIGFMFLIAPAVYAIIAPFVGWIIDKKKVINSLIIAGNVGGAVTFLTIGPVPFFPFLPFNIWFQILSLIVYGCCLALTLCPTFTGLLKSASIIGLPNDVKTHGMVSGISVSCFALGAFLGPTLGGTLVDSFQFPWATCFCSGMFLLSGVMMSVHTMVARIRNRHDGYRKLNNSTKSCTNTTETKVW